MTTTMPGYSGPGNLYLLKDDTFKKTAV